MGHMANIRAAGAIAAAAMWTVIGFMGGMGMAQSPATAPASATATTSPAVMLEKGIYTEETVGDLDAAIKIYQQIVNDAKANRQYAARAQYRLGMCHLKKGDKAKATAELRELQAAYPQEKDIAARSEAQLRKLSPGSYPEPVYEAFSFGPVIERTLNPGDRQHDRLLDLDTGKMFDIPDPEEVKPIHAGGNVAEMKDWAARRGIDLVADGTPLGFELAIFPQPNATWDELPVADGLKVILQSEGATPAVLAPGKELPSTFYFKTREGRLGVLQIIGYDEKKKPGEPIGIKIRYKLLEYSAALAAALAAGDAPRVIKTTPEALANDVEASLDKITVTFARPTKDKSWFWSRTGGGETFPQGTGGISYDAARTTYTMPVKLQPGKVYWVGINSPSHKNFKPADGTPAERYVILFATKSADGKPTPLPADMLKRAKTINAAAATQQAEPSEQVKRDAESLSAEGWRLWNQRKLPEAEAKFQAAVAKDPANANAWNGLGWAQQNQGKPLNAKEAFAKAVAVDPKLAGALNGLGWVAKGQGKTGDAIEYWKKAVAAAPTATAALNGLATTYAELGQYDKAIEACQQWLKVEPENKDAKAALKKVQDAAEAAKSAVLAAEKWLKAIDANKYEQSWDEMAKIGQSEVTKAQWVKNAAMLAPMGELKSRKLLSAVYATSLLDDTPDGHYVTIQYESSFANKKQAVETLIPAREADGTWKVACYFVK